MRPRHRRGVSIQLNIWTLDQPRRPTSVSRYPSSASDLYFRGTHSQSPRHSYPNKTLPSLDCDCRIVLIYCHISLTTVPWRSPQQEPTPTTTILSLPLYPFHPTTHSLISPLSPSPPTTKHRIHDVQPPHHLPRPRWQRQHRPRLPELHRQRDRPHRSTGRPRRYVLPPFLFPLNPPSLLP